MDAELQRSADERFLAVLEESGSRDPRDFYRERLKQLKTADSEAYEKAVRHYHDVLIPSVAAGDSDPLQLWTEYGRLLAELEAPGHTIQIDASGRSAPHEAPAPRDLLVLHLPDARGARALLVALPPDPSSAQLASYALLVQGRLKLRSGP